MKRSYPIIIAGLAGLALTTWFITAGCQDTARAPGSSLFSPTPAGEKWTICCRRLEESGHAQTAENLAAMLRRVEQLDPNAVRVVSDETGSSVLYGEYRRVPAAPGSDQLVFPPELQREMTFIRTLTDGTSTPFYAARPESFETGRKSEHPEWEATNASATHSLLIAVFYNTESFQQRRQVAEQYTAILREEGFPAYYYHEPVKSFVFVGDFKESDVISTPEGPQPGPRVERLIARREAEFRHFTENGHIRKFIEGSREIVPPSRIVPLPRKDGDLN